jgi:phospholipid-binding lipoprotein MlaA
MLANSFRSQARIGKFAVLAVLALLAGCGPAPAPEGINDPYEKGNRLTHRFNLAVDSNVVRPVSRLMGDGTGPVSRAAGNFAQNLGTPSDVANDLLQFRIGHAAHNTLRFLVNTTIGLGGLFDPATAMGAPAKKTDFGETLHVWGVGEGAYVELPLLGPSTQRDALGSAVGLVMDPMNFVLPRPESYYGTAAKGISRLSDRARYSGTLDSILYESADGYAQMRLLYLQNRRYELGQTTGSDAEFVDPYEDPYGQ